MMGVPRSRRVVVLGAGLLVAALVAAGALAWWLRDDRSELERAVSLTPDDTARFSWTHWARVRAELGGEGGQPRLDTLLDRGYEADLTSASALFDPAPVLHDGYGLSPATVEWELLAQSEEYALLLIGLPDDASYEELESRLRDLEYEEPDDATGVWAGSDDRLAVERIPPEFTYLALDPERDLVVTSDSRAGAEAGLESAAADDPPAEGLADVTRTIADAGGPLSAVVYDGEQACSELAMAHADEPDQQYAEQLIEEAGGVNPLRGFAMGLMASDDLRVAMSFETESQARADADARSELASGAAPGQGGEFAERFRLGDVTASGHVVQLEMEPVRGSYAFSDLSTGPLLFATC